MVTFDHRGHGLSGLVDGLPGYANSLADLSQDLLAVMESATARHPDLPLFLFGESMGGAASGLRLQRGHAAKCEVWLSFCLLQSCDCAGACNRLQARKCEHVQAL